MPHVPEAHLSAAMMNSPMNISNDPSQVHAEMSLFCTYGLSLKKSQKTAEPMID